MRGGLTVCVFCASSDRIPQQYRAVAAELGRQIAGYGWALVYGGGSVGLMGEVARAVLEGGGTVTGVIPQRLVEREVALFEVTELLRTETMRERKAAMDDRSDAFIVLPGGIGTLEELVEIVTLKQLGYHDRPVVVLDADGFWDPLLAQLQRMVDQGFAPTRLLELVTFTRTVDATIEAVAIAATTGGRPPVAAAAMVPQEAVGEQLEAFEP